MITGKLNIGIKRNMGGWESPSEDRPDLFVLDFLDDGKVLFMNHKAIVGLSRNDLARCLREVLLIIEEAE